MSAIPLADRPPAWLKAALAKADAEFNAVLDALIAAGRGHERSSDTLAKDDALSLRYAAAAARWRELRYEQERRMRYHGSLRRIRKM